MPIYEYQCQECEHQFDALQRISDALLTDCPECGKPALRKLVSAPGFRLKGSGWYETDFKTGNKKNLAGDNKPAKVDKSKDGKNKSDSKPVAGADKSASVKTGKSGTSGDSKAS